MWEMPSNASVPAMCWAYLPVGTIRSPPVPERHVVVLATHAQLLGLAHADLLPRSGSRRRTSRCPQRGAWVPTLSDLGDEVSQLLRRVLGKLHPALLVVKRLDELNVLRQRGCADFRGSQHPWAHLPQHRRRSCRACSRPPAHGHVGVVGDVRGQIFAESFEHLPRTFSRTTHRRTSRAQSACR